MQSTVLSYDGWRNNTEIDSDTLFTTIKILRTSPMRYRLMRYMSIPPAMPTLRLSISPGMGIETGWQLSSAACESPWPSLPSTKHKPSLLL